MRPLLIALFLSLCALPAAHAQVVRPAPEFTFLGVGNKPQTLKSLRGQPVVLIITQSPKSGAFKAQVKDLKRTFQEFATRQVIFVAAFTKETGPVQSDIPFVIANDGAAIAAAYGLQPRDKFNIAIIGRDGNLDLQTPKVLGAERVRDVIQNSYAIQSTTGR